MISIFHRRPVRDLMEFSRTIAGKIPSRGYHAIDRQKDFRTLFQSTPEGRRVMAQILVRCQLWERSHVPGDPYETARREGMRDIGLWITEIVNTEPGEAPHTAETEEATEHEPPAS